MANIPYVALLSLFLTSCYSFRVPAVNDNPELIVDEELNLIEPKKDFWSIMLRPKAKSSFKDILKLMSNFNIKDRYSVEPQKEIIPRNPTSTEIVIVKKKVEPSRFIIGNRKSSIVSKEIADRESLSEDNRSKVMESISAESGEKSDSSNESTKHDKVSSSQQSESSSDESAAPEKPQAQPLKGEKLRQLETLRYEPDLPQSLHNFEINKPRFQHSIRDGWLF